MGLMNRLFSDAALPEGLVNSFRVCPESVSVNVHPCMVLLHAACCCIQLDASKTRRSTARVWQAEEDAEDADLLQPVTASRPAAAARTAPSDLTFEALTAWMKDNTPAPSAGSTKVHLDSLTLICRRYVYCTNFSLQDED